MDLIERATPAFRTTILALFASGLATFALLYCVQPLLPVFGGVFRITPLVSSLALSVTTALLACAMLVASALSEVLGRKNVMVASVLASSLLGLLCAAAPGYAGLLVLRALMGLSLSGLPAVAMAYVAEEMQPAATGLAMGLYISGNAIGGMTGRLLSGALADAFGWRVALGVIGVEGLVCGAVLWRGLPASRHFVARPFHPVALLRAFRLHLANPLLRCLFAEGFLLMGGFIATYNFVGYRLLAPPFDLTQTEIGLIFGVYLAGVVSSAVMGNLARQLGQRRVVTANIVLMLAGTALTLGQALPLIVLGIAVLTAGFFGAHAVASAWVAGGAVSNRAQASSLYLFSYYAGSSLAGSAAGAAWSFAGWNGVCGVVALLLLAALVLALRLPGAPVPGRAAAAG
jgi:YNFM family putative membrane transporter